MKVIAVLIVISTIATVCAFAPSRSVQYAGRTQSSALDLFNFKTKEASSSSVATTSGGDANAAKKKFDGILKKNAKLILMISGSAKDGIKGEWPICKMCAKRFMCCREELHELIYILSRLSYRTH